MHFLNHLSSYGIILCVVPSCLITALFVLSYCSSIVCLMPPQEQMGLWIQCLSSLLTLRWRVLPAGWPWPWLSLPRRPLWPPRGGAPRATLCRDRTPPIPWTDPHGPLFSTSNPALRITATSRSLLHPPSYPWLVHQLRVLVAVSLAMRENRPLRDKCLWVTSLPLPVP